MKSKDNPGFHKHFSEKRFNPLIDPKFPSLTNVRKEGRDEKDKPNLSQDEEGAEKKPVMTLLEAHKNFRKHFPGLKFKDYFLPDLTYLAGTPKISLTKFDHFLHTKHGDYESEEMSMAEVLEKHYGKEAKNFIEMLL